MEYKNLHKLEGTKILRSGVVYHYTCNSPSQKVLDNNGIYAIGDLFNRDSREVLIIPVNLFEREGIPFSQDENILTINTENLLRRLE